VTDWDDRVTTYEYDNNGRLTKTSRPDGSIEVRTYDAAGRLLSQADKVGETVINARDYIYDEAGNITNITASNGTDISNLTSAEMAYDAANRLIKYNGKPPVSLLSPLYGRALSGTCLDAGAGGVNKKMVGFCTEIHVIYFVTPCRRGARAGRRV
jgi:YD repeat-containing protein